MSRCARWAEAAGLIGLAALTAYLIATSWRKWPDPLIDFGRELYTPWRLAQGAVLYRDADDFYGPLSQYVNAGLFSIFGPGLMVLVTANLVVFAAILAAVYHLFRRGWGPLCAAASCACFVSVFGFSQFVTIGDFNYATPYAHEATHGLLVCLLLAAVLLRWLERATAALSAWAGVLLGLSAVLKPEILFAAFAVTVVAGILGWRRSLPVGLSSAGAWAAGAVAPTVAFAVFFSFHVSPAAALAYACRGWSTVVGTSRYYGDRLQIGFLGFDQPWAHLVRHAWAAGIALLLVILPGWIAWLIGKIGVRWFRCLASAVLAASMAWLAWYGIVWPLVGSCLLGLTLVYLGTCVSKSFHLAAQPPDRRTHDARLLVAVLAAALLARMALNGRIYQFGFYQACLAGALAPAILLGDVPERLRGNRWARTLAITCGFLLVAPGVVKLVGRSQALLRSKTYSVGEGRDRFYAFPSRLIPDGPIVAAISGWLRGRPGGETALVLPEGEMINYLARKSATTAPFFYFSATTGGGGEEKIVEELQARPPDWVVILSRDLREYGVKTYGESPGQGELILRWVMSHYRPVFRVGGDPLSPDQSGGVILGRNGL